MNLRIPGLQSRITTTIQKEPRASRTCEELAMSQHQPIQKQLFHSLAANCEAPVVCMCLCVPPHPSTPVLSHGHVDRGHEHSKAAFGGMWMSVCVIVIL